MTPSDEKRTFPARERWFWVGVGFVCALAVLVSGLGVATYLMANEPRRPMTRQAAEPFPPEQRVAPVVQPPSPLEPANPVRTGAAPLNHPAVVTGPVPRARAPRKPVSPVRIVERADPPRVARSTPRPSPPKSEAAEASPGPIPSPSRGPLAGPARPPVEQVGGSREERADVPPRDRTGVTSRRDRSQPAIAEDVEPTNGSRGTSAPELIVGREAEYPPDAMADGVTGTVALKIIVAPDGFVERAVVVRSSGDRRLDAAAVRAALGWRYKPAHRGPRAVAGVDTATFEFFREGRGQRPSGANRQSR